MSDNRDDAGQFTPSTDGLFGREHELVSAGYTVKKDEPPADDKTYGSDSTSLREAAADLKAERGEPEDPIAVNDILDLDPKEAVTTEQAARELGTARADIATFYDGMDLAKFADEVDADRAKVIKGDPKVAEALGVEMPAKDAATTKGEAVQNAPDQVDAATVDAIDAMEGLDPETRKALKIPQVRQALEQQFAEADQVREQYASSLQNGQQMLQATLTALAPQLQGMPLEHWPQAIQMLAQVDPGRAQLVSDTLTNWGTIQQAQQQEQQRQASIAHQQFEAQRQQYSRQADQALGPMTVAEKLEMVEELVGYVGDFGISREQFTREAQTNLAIHHPAFQRMAADALKYQRIMKASKAMPTRNIPPVQRPGASQPRAPANSANIQALERQLSSATGHKAARIAADILRLQRKAAS
jgi:hypothetical protein